MNEVNDVAPSSLSHLVGQRSVIEQVRVAIDAAFADNRKFDSAMLVGPPGVGKTALASVVAQEMATDFHDVLGQSIKGISDLNALLLAANDKDVIHIDERTNSTSVCRQRSILAIDRKKVLVRGGGKGQVPSGLTIGDFTLLAEHDGRVLPAPATSRSDAAGPAIRILLGGGTDDRAQASNKGAGVECRGWSVAVDSPAISRHTSLGAASASICSTGR